LGWVAQRINIVAGIEMLALMYVLAIFSAARARQLLK